MPDITSVGTRISQAAQTVFRACANNTPHRVDTGPTNGGLTNGNSKTIHYFGAEGANQIQVVYSNWHSEYTVWNDRTNLVAAADLTINASIEDENGYIYPLTFNGQKTIVLKPNAVVKCDPFYLKFRPMGYCIIRTHYNGASWPKARLSCPNLGQFFNEDSSTTDCTTGGADLADNGVNGYGPTLILGDVQKSVVCLGDSITQGTGMTFNERGRRNTLGWAETRIHQSFGIPTVNLSEPGAQGYHFSEDRRVYVTKQILALANPTHVVFAFGTNDIAEYSLSQLQPYFLDMFREQKGYGRKLIVPTICPETASSDSWATNANQTPDATSTPRRNAVNAWFKTLVGTEIDAVADIDALAADGDVWDVEAGYKTTDGLHPAQTISPGRECQYQLGEALTASMFSATDLSVAGKTIPEIMALSGGRMSANTSQVDIPNPRLLGAYTAFFAVQFDDVPPAATGARFLLSQSGSNRLQLRMEASGLTLYAQADGSSQYSYLRPGTPAADQLVVFAVRWDGASYSFRSTLGNGAGTPVTATITDGNYAKNTQTTPVKIPLAVIYTRSDWTTGFIDAIIAGGAFPEGPADFVYAPGLSWNTGESSFLCTEGECEITDCADFGA